MTTSPAFFCLFVLLQRIILFTQTQHSEMLGEMKRKKNSGTRQQFLIGCSVENILSSTKFFFFHFPDFLLRRDFPNSNEAYEQNTNKHET